MIKIRRKSLHCWLYFRFKHSRFNQLWDIFLLLFRAKPFFKILYHDVFSRGNDSFVKFCINPNNFFLLNYKTRWLMQINDMRNCKSICRCSFVDGAVRCFLFECIISVILISSLSSSMSLDVRPLASAACTTTSEYCVKIMGSVFLCYLKQQTWKSWNLKILCTLMCCWLFFFLFYLQSFRIFRRFVRWYSWSAHDLRHTPKYRASRQKSFFVALPLRQREKIVFSWRTRGYLFASWK